VVEDRVLLDKASAPLDEARAPLDEARAPLVEASALLVEASALLDKDRVPLLALLLRMVDLLRLYGTFFF
jgi:hypothetical protein